jgi:site-specific DNA-adenine methylase
MDKLGGRANLIQRTGSKTNDIKYFIDYLPVNVKNVVEPFGGSFAVIRDVYSDKKYKKYVNDADDNLYYIYKHPNELIKAFEAWNIINDKKIFATKKKEIFMKTKFNEAVKKIVIDSSIVRGLITNSKNLEDADKDIKFMKTINFTNDDAFKIIDKFKYKSNSFIFLDPPYLFSNNETYNPQKDDPDNTDFYIKFYNILKDKSVKAKIMLIINDLKVLRWIFQDFIVGDYEKIYQASKKKTKHLIITNY